MVCQTYFLGISVSDWVMISAVFLGPLIAIQIQKWLENGREKKSRKLNVFRTLMTTRSARLSYNHVQALNMIDLEFHESEYEDIVSAWRIYHDHLSNGHEPDQAWQNKSLDLLIDMLHVMGTKLGYKFDKVMIRRITYSPVGHETVDFEEQQIRQGLSKVLNGEAQFPVFISNLHQHED